MRELFFVYECSLARRATGRVCTNLRELLEAMRTASDAVLEHHMKALDLTDDRSIKEQEIYRQLAKRHRLNAAQLHETAELMASAHDLPMGPVRRPVAFRDLLPGRYQLCTTLAPAAEACTEVTLAATPPVQYVDLP